ncbi:MAG: hypothetical protein IJ622_03675 [Bacteroidales bacterium]|nr:hypothetical protein [Bacteroidales bacterium]
MKTRKSIRRIAFIIIGTLLFVQGYAQNSITFKFSETAPAQVLRVMESNAKALFTEINQKYDQDNSQLSLSSSAVTDFARNRIANMWAVSHFYCTRTNINTRVMRMVSSNTYQVRNIPVCYKEGETEEYKYQMIVLEFDMSGKISDLYCTMPEHMYTEVINGGNEVTNNRHRWMIKNFVDNFFTAYNLGLGGLDLIDKMYSEDALIITGKVVNYKTSRNTEFSRTLTNNQCIEYSIQNKRQYMEKLRGIFARNSYINIRFDGVEVVQSEANSNIYGVRLNQYWHVAPTAKSKGYSDEGKLFLIIDFSNEEQPEVWVRTWQPYQDANGNPIQYTEEEFFTIGDFQIE